MLALSAWALYDTWQTWRTDGRGRGVRALLGLARHRWSFRSGSPPSCLLRSWPSAPGWHTTPMPRSGLDVPRRYHLWVLNVWQLLSLRRPSVARTTISATIITGKRSCRSGWCPWSWRSSAHFRHPDRRLVRGWLVLAALAIWLACGRHLFLFTVAYLTVPGMSWFRVPARALFLANVAAAVLAGLGVETLRKHMTAPRDWHALARRFTAITSLVLAALLAILLVRGTDGSSRSAAATAHVIRNGCFWLTLGGMGGLICLGTLSGQPGGRRWAGGLMGLVALCELGSYGFTLMRVAPAERFLGDDPVGAALIRLDRESHRSGRIRIKARDSFYSDLRAARLGHRKDQHQRRLSARQRRPALPTFVSRRGVSASPARKPHAACRRSIPERDQTGGFRSTERRLPRLGPV